MRLSICGSCSYQRPISLALLQCYEGCSDVLKHAEKDAQAQELHRQAVESWPVSTCKPAMGNVTDRIAREAASIMKGTK